MGDPDGERIGEPVGDALDRLLKHLRSAPMDTLTGIRSQWIDIVGPTLAAVSRPVTIQDGLIVIGCDEPTWAAQLRWMEGTICSKVQERFAGVEVRGIRVRQRRQ